MEVARSQRSGLNSPMRDFWHLARLLLARRVLLAAALACAMISAGGMGAGLLAMKPVLDTVFSQGTDLLGMAAAYNRLTFPAWTGVSMPEWAKLSESTIAGLPEGPFNAVLFIVMGLGVLTLIGATANFLHAYFSLTMVSQTIGRIRRDCFDRVVHWPLSTVQSHGPSDIVSRIVYDTGTLGGGLNALLSKALAQVTKAIGAVLAALYLDWKVVLVTIPVAVVMGVIIRKLGKRIRRASRGALQSYAGLYQTANEAVGHLRVVKVHSGEPAESARFTATNDEVIRQELRVRTARAVSGPLIETLTILVLGGLMLIGTKAIIDKAVEPGEFLTVLAALALAASQLKPLTGFISDMQQSGAAATRLRELLGTAVEPATGVAIPRHRESIVFENVSFTYPGARVRAIDGVTLEIKHGSTVALVGPNGSGKTTLLALIPRLYEPDSGRVLIDGVPISGARLDSLRAQIGVVTQDTVLFKGSIRANLLYGAPAATEDQLRDATQKARAEEFVLAKAGGFDALLAEGGAGLSGGQRQRLAIARAILREPAILILDEATSMIDADSEAKIAAAIDDFVSESHARRTCLIVAHRLSTVVHADRIVVMDQGRLVDQGTHAELLQRCAVYQQIAEHQLVRAPAVVG